MGSKGPFEFQPLLPVLFIPRYNPLMALKLKDLDEYIKTYVTDEAFDSIYNSSPIFSRLASGPNLLVTSSAAIQASPYVPEGYAFLMDDHGIQSVITGIGPAEPNPVAPRVAPGIRKLDLPKA